MVTLFLAMLRLTNIRSVQLWHPAQCLAQNRSHSPFFYSLRKELDCPLVCFLNRVDLMKLNEF